MLILVSLSSWWTSSDQSPCVCVFYFHTCLYMPDKKEWWVIQRGFIMGGIVTLVLLGVKVINDMFMVRENVASKQVFHRRSLVSLCCFRTVVACFLVHSYTQVGQQVRPGLPAEVNNRPHTLAHMNTQQQAYHYAYFVSHTQQCITMCNLLIIQSNKYITTYTLSVI